MGGHLVSAMALTRKASPNTEVLSALRSAHDDMRLLIDGSSVEQANLGEILGLLRPRLQAQLDAAAVQLQWCVDATTDLPVLDAQQRMHVVRIVQECVTNVIKHANANRLTLSCGYDAEGKLVVSASDDGSNARLRPSSQTEGHGLRNIRYRAEQLGAEFSFSTTPCGGVARLVLPDSVEDSASNTYH